MDMITLAMAKKYTDSQRLAWAKTSMTELFPPTPFAPFSYAEDRQCYMSYMALTSAQWKEYRDAFKDKMGISGSNVKGVLPVKVEFDGVVYDTTAVYVDDISGSGSVSIRVGNYALLGNGGEDTGESFLLYLESWDGRIALCLTTEEGETHTIRVYELSETIHPIDPKLLPKERCIKSIEVQDASVMSVVIDKDSSGDAFALSKLYMRVTSPIASAAVSANILLSDSDGNRVWGYSSTVSNTSKKYTHRLWAVKKPYGYDVDIANIGSATYNLVDDSAVSEAAIAKVTLTTETAFAEGTIIELWGC